MEKEVLKQEKENLQKKEIVIYKKWWFWLIIIIVVIVYYGSIYYANNMIGKKDIATSTNKTYNNTAHKTSNLGKQNNASSKPDDVELLTYAQMVLDNKLNNPKYSNYTGDYNFVGTGLRYKIEGKVNNEKFWMIIEFTDETYKEYDLISLQVGKEHIYKRK